MSFVLLDFETASAVDLKKAGAWRYAEDPTTEILVLGYHFSGSETQPSFENVLLPHMLPLNSMTALEILACDPSVAFVAHNTGFEKAIWRKIMMPVFGWPDVPNSRWHDSQAVCAYKALPLGLERAALALRLAIQKDMDGSKFTIGLSKPKKDGSYDRSPEAFARVSAYVRTDVRAELELCHRIGGLSDRERKVWLLDQRINERGVMVDLAFVDKCQSVVDGASRPLAAEFERITGFTKVGTPKLIDWAASKGVKLDNLRKETISALLGAEDEESFDEESKAEDRTDYSGTPLFGLPADVRRALDIRRTLGSASVKKLRAIRECVCCDGRVRGTMQYHAAGPGRWAGRLFQPHNFPRGSNKLDGNNADPELVAEAIKTGDWQYVESVFGPAIETVSFGLRHAIVASPGRSLVVGDFETIEARIVLALAGQHDRVKKIAAGEKPYIPMAEAIYGRKIDKVKDIQEYTIGKNTVLGCGFQMGYETFGRRYAPNADEAFLKRVIKTYREDWAPEVPKLWAALEDAGVRCVWDKKPIEAYGCRFEHEDMWLTIRLPSGRKLWYANPTPIRKAMTWDETDVRFAWTCKAWKKGRWMARDMYGGLLTENVVQGLARDIMVEAMFKCENNNLPIVLTVHDEIVAEPLKEHAGHAMLRQIMADRPKWASDIGIPVSAETWAGDRYKK